VMAQRSLAGPIKPKSIHDDVSPAAAGSTSKSSSTSRTSKIPNKSVVGYREG
jgi:hypothetical protein